MSTGAIATITRREVRDMVSDWRIMVPIFLLTFILPLMLVGASGRLIRVVQDTVEDRALAESLIPFAILVVGFIPSSFSLITALESFVGERERNSLEALLSMPISDHELYTGKLFSSLLTPLLSSYTAMLIYSFLLYSINSALYFGAITPIRLALLFLIVGLIAVTMVAGAVVISTHISSIRAANLMSSFILVPMLVVVQMAAFLIINNRWDVLWTLSAALAVLSLLLVRLGLLTFNREEILSREHQHETDFKVFTFLTRSFNRGASLDYATRQPPVLAIARRELRETLTDWRVLAPSLVLSLIIPLVLVGGTDFAVNFLEQPRLVARLVPFAMLLVGFIPASFSLIVALDSFVGERERNSLEALLALPISDNQLYASKLASSVIAPLVMSLGAMMVFAFAMSRLHPDLYYYAMTPEAMLQLVLMISIMVILMVAGAVVISSHTGTIRAANLLASFVLLPMAVVVQLQALLIISARWDAMWFVVWTLAVVAVALIRTGMGAFNREEILSREHEEFNLNRIKQTLGIFFREYQPAGVLPEHYRGDTLAPRRFYTQEFPALLRDLRLPLILASLAVVGGLLAGWYIGEDYRFIGSLHNASNEFVAGVGQQVPPPSLELALLVFANNVRVSLLSNVFSSFAFGLFAFMVPMIAFMQIGFVTTRLHVGGGSWFALGADSPLQFMLAYVAPHGIIELPTFILSAALGIRIGASLMSPPEGFTVAQNLLWSLANFFKVWLLVLLPLIVLASLVEGLISPMVIQALYQI